MNCVIIRDTLLKRIFQGNFGACVKNLNGFRSSVTRDNIRYFQPRQRYFKTSANFQLSNTSETYEGESSEKYPINKGEESRMVETTLEKQMLTALDEYPSLAQISASQLKSFLCYLSELGFSVDDGVAMIYKCTDILRRNQSQLQHTVECFMRCGFSEDDLSVILQSSPEYFLMDSNDIVARYKSLRNFFSHNLMTHIFINSPSVVRIGWQEILGKLEYLKNVMRVPNHEIARSKALVCPIDVLKTRHLFLERAGLFKLRNPKSNIPTGNHNLSQIIDTDDDYFAEKIAGLTVEEYLVFQELLPLEGRNTESHVTENMNLEKL